MTDITLDQAAKILDDSKKLSSEDKSRLATQKSAGVVTPIVLAKALGIRPQMVYNYIRDGRISAYKDQETQKLVISRAVAETWIMERELKSRKKAQEKLEAAKQANS